MRRYPTFQWSPQIDNYRQYTFVWKWFKKGMKLQVRVKVDDKLGTGMQVATMDQGDGQISKLSMPFAGQVLKVFEGVTMQPEEDVNRLELFLFQMCDHQPISEQQRKCRYCGQDCWTYQEPTETAYTLGNFRIRNPYNELIWNLSVGQHFSKQQKIGSIDDDEIALDFPGRIIFLGEGGQFDKPILIVRRTVCKHQKVYENICCHCLQHVQDQVVKSLAAQSSSGIVMSGKTLQEAQDSMLQELLNQKRIILILDLDNTILHCLETTIHQKFPTNYADYFTQTYGQILMIIKMRPYLKEFLKKILPLYDVYVYTKATREYAQSACKYIRTAYEDLFEGDKYKLAFTPSRIVSRDEDNNLEKKSFDKILSKEHCVAIMDDRRDVWGAPDNAVFVKFFKFFSRNDKMEVKIPTSQDFYLSFAADYMADLHKKYFQELESRKTNKKDIKITRLVGFGEIVRKARKQLLKDYVAFSAIQNEANRNNVYKRAQNLGMLMTEDIKKANIVLYDVVPKDHKYYEGALQIPLVHISWLGYCQEYNWRFRHETFRYKPDREFGHLTPQQRQQFDLQLFKTHRQQF